MTGDGGEGGHVHVPRSDELYYDEYYSCRKNNTGGREGSKDYFLPREDPSPPPPPLLLHPGHGKSAVRSLTRTYGVRGTRCTGAANSVNYDYTTTRRRLLCRDRFVVSTFHRFTYERELFL